MNDALTRLMNADNSAAKPLLDKYRALTTVQVPRDNSAIRPVPRNAGRHDSFVEIAKKGDIDLLLVGDSITDLWRNSTETYATYFGKYKVANFAISGDTTQGVLWGLQNGEGTGFQPKAIMMMIGTNNSGGNTGPEIAEGVGAIVLELRKDFPNAKILLLAIFPRNAPTSAGRRVNAEASAIYSKLGDNKNIFYMDIGQKFLSPDGTISTEIMADGLHPTAKGYVVWGEAIKDKLAELMK
jgi:beta-glucosidase